MLQEGDTAPGFELESTAGGTVRLAERLEAGPVVVVTNRGYWCSYCAEQLLTFGALAYDLWRNHATSVLPVLGDPVPELVEMRDRFDLGLQLLSDPSLEVARPYAGVDEHPRRGPIPVAGTFVLDTDGVVRYAQVAQNPADRTYANYVRALIAGGFERPYG